MNVFEAVASRHSVRKYDAKPIPDDDLRDIISAALKAPTWANGQEVRYSIVESEEALDLLAESSSYNKKYIQRATKILVVSVVEDVAAPGDCYSHTSFEWSMFDAGLSVAMLTLLAWEKGLGTVILGDYDTKVVSSAAGLPDNEIPVAMICMGYPAYPPKGPSKRQASELIRAV